MSDKQTAAVDREPVITIECRVSGEEHAVPGPDTRIYRVADGGFIVACGCGVEPIEET